MVSGTEGELPKSKIDPCGICGRRVMANSVQCTKCRNWIHGRCTKAKKGLTTLAQSFVCSRCRSKEGIVVPVETLHDGIE